MARTENELKNLMNEKSKKEREYLQSKLKGNSECKRITLKEEIINEYKNGNLTLEEILEEKELNGSIIDVVRFYASIVKETGGMVQKLYIDDNKVQSYEI